MADKADRKSRAAAAAKTDKAEKSAKGKAEAAPSHPRVPARLRERFRSEIAPALIVVFAQKHGTHADEKNYYVNESVGIAVGFLLAALNYAGIATLTHTPSPMNFLSEVLERPSNERAYVLIPVGYPAHDAEVPDIEKKPLSEVLVIKE